MGENFYSNHNLVILDGNKVTFGDNVFIAPNCGFYTAGHPLDCERRNQGLEFGKGNKIRYILMSDAIYEALNEYLPEREKILNGKENKYLIISNRTANNGKKIHRSLVNKLLSKYCEELKEENIHLHQFRHQYATNKYQEGYNEMMLKKSLGQSSNVVNRYVHESYEEEIAKRVRERKNNTKYSNE